MCSRRVSPIETLSFADDLLLMHIILQRNSAIFFAEICENKKSIPFKDC